MDIRRAIPAEREALLNVWLRSVHATHTFVSEEELQSMIPEVREYLRSDEPEFSVLCDDSGAIMGFMGMSGRKMDSLFLAPEFHRRGGGRRLVRHAQRVHGELRVDVNEQNSAARAFYEACGFVAEGRSELDDQGRPYPLVRTTVQKAMEVAGGIGFYRSFGLERMLRDVQAAPYHPLPERRQLHFTGRLALGLLPI